MALVKKVVSPERQRASRANSLRSAGPRTELGRSIVSRNLPRPHGSPVAELYIEALAEDPADFEKRLQELTKALAPRDGFEDRLVEGIATLQWRLGRLQRAESAKLAWRKRQQEIERQRKSLHQASRENLKMAGYLRLVGFAGSPESAQKFIRVLDVLRLLRAAVVADDCDQNALTCLGGLYGSNPEYEQQKLKNKFEMMLEERAAGNLEQAELSRKEILAELNKEFCKYKQLQALYAEEHLEANPLREDAELLPPAKELKALIRYEAHLERQIERKLRQFYARRREAPRAEEAPALGAPQQAVGPGTIAAPLAEGEMDVESATEQKAEETRPAAQATGSMAYGNETETRVIAPEAAPVSATNAGPG